MPAKRAPRSMDNPWYDWSPINTRAPLRWPGDARVAFGVIVNLEYAELTGPPGSVAPPSSVRRGPFPELADVHETTPIEYGNRVGVFRVMKVLDRHGIRATAALDAAVAQRYPYIVAEGQKRSWEFIGHSLVYTRMITEKMPEAEEREYIRAALDAVKEATGKPVRGWIGADYGESSRTVGLLAEEGVEYVCDWPNDEQPYRMKVPVKGNAGSMVSMPTMLDLDESYTHRGRRIPIQRWTRMVIEAFDRMYADAEKSGRMLLLSIHPWLIGQPYRIGALDDALGHIMRHSKVWAATGSEIMDWYLEQKA
jgi:peptidoglycan/xylan/chitin deacetylase (PgdA/CDA1 family)